MHIWKLVRQIWIIFCRKRVRVLIFHSLQLYMKSSILAHYIIPTLRLDQLTILIFISQLFASFFTCYGHFYFFFCELSLFIFSPFHLLGHSYFSYWFLRTLHISRPTPTDIFCKYFFILFFFFNFYLFIYLFLAVLGLRFCVRAFSSCGERGPLFIAVRGPHCCGLSCCRAQAPDAQAQ